jgi:formate--tetrahydrofolate ligase
MPTDIEIAHACMLRRSQVATEAGILRRTGTVRTPKAKVSLASTRVWRAPKGRYVLVTAITPTPFARARRHHRRLAGARAERHSAFSCIRQPSLGRSSHQGLRASGSLACGPMEDINLHLTVTCMRLTAGTTWPRRSSTPHLHVNELGNDPTAHRVAAASSHLDPRAQARRDRPGCKRQRHPAVNGLFEIAVASEIMAILAHAV